MEEELKKQIKEAYLVFNLNMLNKDGDSLMCSLNKTFGESFKVGHNCLGCNLNEDVEFIDNFLKNSIESNYFVGKLRIDYFFKPYLIHLYLLTEKILEIKKIIGLPSSYQSDKYEVFKTIKLWANFFKHPKAFILTHHPNYIFEKENLPKTKGQIFINREYLKKYYSGEDLNKYNNLMKDLSNNNDVIVCVPNIIQLTKDFCLACEDFIRIIENNNIYKEILNDISTIEGYYKSN